MDARVKPEHDGCVCGTGSAISSFVMPGLEPGIHGLPSEEGSGGSLARLRMTEGAASMANSTFDPEHCIELAKFPVRDREGAGWRRFLARGRAELDESGACNLDGFLRPEAAAAMAREAVGLQPLAYEKKTVRNAYFSKDDPA